VKEIEKERQTEAPAKNRQTIIWREGGREGGEVRGEVGGSEQDGQQPAGQPFKTSRWRPAVDSMVCVSMEWNGMVSMQLGT